jgi:hypothetical protein
MAMLGWIDYRSRIFARVGGIAKLSLDTAKGYMTLGGARAKTGHLDGKIRQLKALAVAITDGVYRRFHDSREGTRRRQGGDH